MHIVKRYKNMPVQVKASFWFLICSFLQKGITMLTTPIFTRLLSTDEYGQYGVFNSWYGIIIILVGLALYAGVYTQGLVKFEDDRAVFSSSLQGLSTILVVIWTIVYISLHQIWNSLIKLTTVQMLLMLVMVWTTAVFNYWANEQRVTYSYKKLVIVTILVSISKPIIGIIFVTNANDKVTARILGLALVELIGYSWMFISQIRKGKVLYSSKYWKYALAFNLPLIPHYLSQTVLNSADRIMIRDMIGKSEAGIYNLAYSISLIMALFNTALSQTITPWMYTKIKNNRIKDIGPIAYITLIIIAIVNILLILLAPEAVKIFAPQSYYEAIWVIPPVALSVYFMYCYDIFAKVAFYYEKTKFIMIASVLGALLNIVLNYYFINKFGYVAAGYTTLVCFIVYSLLHYLFMRKICKEKCEKVYPFETKKVLAITAPFIVIGLLMLFTYNYPLIRYSMVIIIFIIGFIFRRKIKNTLIRIVKLKKTQE